MNVLITRRALLDMEEIGDFIAQDNLPRALTFVTELRTFCLGLADRPRGHVQVEGLLPDLRRATYGNYSIYYRVLPSEIRVSRILHSARLIAADMFTD